MKILRVTFDIYETGDEKEDTACKSYCEIIVSDWSADIIMGRYPSTAIQGSAPMDYVQTIVNASAVMQADSRRATGKITGITERESEVEE